MPCLGCCSRARASLSTSSELQRISANGHMPTEMTGSYTSGGFSPTNLENRTVGANGVPGVNVGESEYEYVSVIANEKRSSKEEGITPVHGASSKKDLQNLNPMKKQGSKTRIDNGAEDAIVLASAFPPPPRTPTTPVIFDAAPPSQPRSISPQPHSSEVSVQVEVHSCGSVSASGGTGSVISSCDESLGAAPASSPSPHAPSPALAPDAHHSEERMVAEPEYEDIYQLREEALGQPLPQSLLTVPNGPSSGGALRRDGDDEGTNGDGAVDGDGERQRRPSASHTLPPPLPPASAPNPRALKRVVSEPPPPPPPPPSGLDLRAPSPIPPLGGGDCAPMSLPAALPPSPAVTPEPVLRPSEVP